MDKFGIEKALGIINCTTNPFQTDREGLCDGIVDSYDLSFYENADLNSWSSFKSRYRCATEEFYNALTVYEEVFGNGDGVLQKEDFRSVPVSRTVDRKGFLLQYPETKTVDVKDQFFGTMVPDPYRWLEDESSPEVRAWMAAQNKLSRAVMGLFPGREKLIKRLKELYYVASIRCPSKKGNRLFYYRKDVGDEKWIYYFREGSDEKEKVLIDPNRLDPKSNVSLGTAVPSYDGRKLAYTLKINNADEATLHVMDVTSGKTSDIDKIDGAKYSMPKWTPEGDGFYYTWLPTDPKIPAADRPGYAEVRFHKLGTDSSKDKTVFNRTNDPTTFIWPGLSRDGKWLVVYVKKKWRSNDVFIKDLTKPGSEFELFYRGTNASSFVLPWRDNFYIMTNDGTPNWRIDKVDANNRERGNWKTIISERKDTVINHIKIIGGHLVVGTLKDASSSLEVRTLDGKMIRKVSVPGIGDTSDMIGDPDEDIAYFSFQSFTMPRKIYRTSISTGESSLWAEMKVPLDPSPYVVDQIFYPSKDGTKIPMFIVRRKDMPRNGSTPVFFTGYGGFGRSLTPMFGAWIYPWLEAGGAYAMANLRGGGEYGEEWHRAGMLDKKQNVFDDFIAGAEFLITEGYTNPEKLVIKGSSNAGLLVGVAMTQRPDLFKAVVCGVPLLDMIRYDRFDSGKTWIGEYGSADDEKQFKTLFSYSPYHHVSQNVDYPAVLFLSSASDDRVNPMHARKMTAAMQNASIDGNPVFLRIQENAGHTGVDQIKKSIEIDADMYSFLMGQLNISL